MSRSSSTFAYYIRCAVSWIRISMSPETSCSFQTSNFQTNESVSTSDLVACICLVGVVLWPKLLVRKMIAPFNANTHQTLAICPLTAMTFTNVVLPENCSPTSVSSISSFQNRLLNQSSIRLIIASILIVYYFQISAQLAHKSTHTQTHTQPQKQSYHTQPHTEAMETSGAGGFVSNVVLVLFGVISS